MIAQLTGEVRSISVDRIILEVAGVGYLVSVTPITSSAITLGTTVTLHTSMIVREDSMTLFGFIDQKSRETFELVQTVSGIGPRVALSILAPTQSLPNLLRRYRLYLVSVRRAHRGFC